MHVVDHHSVQDLQRLIRKQTRAQLLQRLQMVLLAKQGQTAPRIAHVLGSSRRVVQTWIYRYNAQGWPSVAAAAINAG